MTLAAQTNLPAREAAITRVFGANERASHALQPHSAAFDGGRIVLCMPLLYAVEPETFESITIALSRFDRTQVRFMAQEKTLVHDARNRLAHRFLQTDAQWMLTCDGDLLYPCGHAGYYNARGRVQLPERIGGMNFIERMLAHPIEYGVIGGSYKDRQVGTQLQCSRGCGSNAEPGFTQRWERGEITGVGEVAWTAAGCMRVHRSVLEHMRDEAPKRFPEIVPIKGEIFGFFTPVRVQTGEDVSFCARCHALGFKIWQDYDLRILHKMHSFV